MKKCKNCKKYQTIKNFSKDVSFKDNLYPECKFCYNIKRRKSNTFFNIIKNGRLVKHGLACKNKTIKEYYIYVAAKQRCTNSKNKRYKYYGGRGIKFKLNSVLDIINSIGYKPVGKYSLDRINNNGNYEIGNIRWATSKEQSMNKQNNINITYRGKTHTLFEWSKILNISYGTLMMRKSRGGDVKKILSKLNNKNYA